MRAPFPDRDDSEASYLLTPEYRRLIDKVMSYARETVKDTSGGQSRQRVRWWSVLALLRSMASSPAAAAFTLRNRAQVAGAESEEEADHIGRHTVLDLTDSDATEGIDVAPSADIDEESETSERKVRNRLLAMAREAEALKGAKDAKLQKAITFISDLVKQGYQPLVFCRFIPTAEYVAQELRKHLPKQVEVAAVTGQLPPVEREERVLQLAKSPQRVLVCTDCLSEGINLQEYFNAVFHYDLSWNPTRHEQREGRVDRFGQARSKVKVLTYYGKDNTIDSIVLDVLINKHRTIRNTLGISVPVPMDTEQVVEAIFEGVLRDADQSSQSHLPGFEDVVHEKREELFRQWDASSEREKVSRTIFAQHSIKVDEVEKELNAVRGAIGLSDDVAEFTTEALQAYGAFIGEAAQKGAIRFNLQDVPIALRDAIDLHRFTSGKEGSLHVSFTQTGLPNALYLSRTHPLVEGLAAYVMDTALDSLNDSPIKPIARRCGLIKTSKVQTRTTLLLVRLRFHLQTPQRAGKEVQPLLAEECRLFAFRGIPQEASWFDDAQEIEALLHAESQANIPRVQIQHFLQQVRNGFDEYLQPKLEQFAHERATELLQAHRRVRRAASLGVRNVVVQPQLPPDIFDL